MRVLFVSGELIAGDVAYRLKLEGCDVKLYIADKSRRDCFEGMVKKTADWKKELSWVGKGGLIVFDDVIFNGVQGELRQKGYTVFGGCADGDRAERDREWAQKLFARCGLKVEESKNFSGFDAAIKYVEKHPARWVLKQNGHHGSLSYVGVLSDSRDVLNVLKNYRKYNKNQAVRNITLQKKVDGVEVAIARFFNGCDWNSPIFVSFEHKPFLNDDVGPLTAEMGTLAWYDKDENNRLFQATLEKIKPYLRKIDYRGYVDINSIVSGNRLVPLEATMRFGSPTNQLQSGMHLSSWKDLLWSTARGEKADFSHHRGFSVVVSVAIPPFPYPLKNFEGQYLKGVDILFTKEPTAEEWRRIHFEEVSARPGKPKQYYISGSNGYILFITGSGSTVEEARAEAYKLVKKIVIPKMMYRTDIGSKFIRRDRKLLREWGWIK